MSGGEHSPPELANEIATGIGLFFNPCSLGCAFPSDISYFLIHIQNFFHFLLCPVLLQVLEHFCGMSQKCSKNSCTP